MGKIPWLEVKDRSCLQDAFRQQGITGWDSWSFERLNLVTGENGSGKSRLLRAIRGVCLASDIPCIYMDFTKIGRTQSSEGAEDTEGDGLVDSLVYHGTLPQKIYGDFIPFLERDIEKFSQYLNGLDSEGKEKIALKRRSEINQFLKEQLGREFDFSDEGCRITSREKDRPPLSFAKAVAEMSPGEKGILYFALGILCMKVEEKMGEGFVLLLDEPENHLHTKALVRLIREVKELNKYNVHAVVASHSIFLVPLFRFEEIIFISESRIHPATSSKYADAYHALIGDPDEEGGSLKELLSSLSQWNFSNYLVECLCAPSVSDQVRSSDPQFQKLLKELRPLAQRKKIRLLDYGGGSGRIAKCMELHFQKDPNDPLASRLTYDVYDLSLDRDKMPKAPWMGQLYEEADKGRLRAGSYDLVVLYNVLHEIDVTEWADTLIGILNLLKDDGLLVFGERRVLSQGERPYGKSGYLVLDHNELTRLFGGMNVGEPIQLYDDNHIDGSAELPRNEKDPTICCVIRKPYYLMILDKDVQKVLQSVRKRSKTMIDQYIGQGTTVKKSREYAFYCQQYINAEHALEILKGSEKPVNMLDDSIGTIDISSMSCSDIVNNHDGEERINYMKKRAEIGDEEGEKCREWLEVNGQTSLLR